MDFEWDEATNAANVRKHGLDFTDVVGIFDGPVVTRVDDRFDYGEVRRITTGAMAGVLIVTAVHTDRHGRTRLISARRASLSERTYYEASLRAAPDT